MRTTEAALAAHYAHASDDWQASFVSSYASAHPWEDFAETWAHCIHIVDTLETAHDARLRIGSRNLAAPLPRRAEAFTTTIDDWLALSVALNQLNRSMGMRDAYPFTLSDRVIEKLAFVRQLCADAGMAERATPRRQRGRANGENPPHHGHRPAASRTARGMIASERHRAR